MNSCLYRGWVDHRRQGAVEHAFRFPLVMAYLDLDELAHVFPGRGLASARGPALLRFRRDDHLGDPTRPLDVCVRALVAAETGARPDGPIRLLTQLRYAGRGFNPVSFYYCFAPDGERVETLVAEVTNFPWRERHTYVVPARAPRHAKTFHVSPFLDMDLDYAFSWSVPGPQLELAIANLRGGEVVFDARLALERRAFSARALAGAALRYPFQATRVVAGIYAQALRLRLKGARYHPHPGRTAEALTA